MTKVINLTKKNSTAKLANVSLEKRFWCYDGSVLHNLAELKSALETMNDEVFNYHVNDYKNDFSRWVKDVIGDNKLAKDLQKSNNQAQAARAVSDRITWLKNKKETD